MLNGHLDITGDWVLYSTRNSTLPPTHPKTLQLHGEEIGGDVGFWEYFRKSGGEVEKMGKEIVARKFAEYAITK